MERASLLVVSLALILLGIWELVTWPQWALSDSALFILIGKGFLKIYAVAELTSASLFTLFGLFGIYFAIVESDRSHKVTGKFELFLLFPLSVLMLSAGAFALLGSELMAHNSILTALAGRIWRWRYQHTTHKNSQALARIEEIFQCCGWGSSNSFTVSRFCQEIPHKAIHSCAPFVLNHSGRAMYRQGLMVIIYTAPLVLLTCVTIWSHKTDPISADVEEAEMLDERRKQLYSGNAPAIQLH